MKYLVLDIGGTTIKYAHMDESGTILFQNKVETPLRSYDEFWNVMDSLVMDEFAGVAVSFPGPIDADAGIVIDGGSLRYMKIFAFTKKMQERYHIPCTLENDARCAALAEVWKGNLRDVSIGMVIVFGTGIGSSVTINGELFKGAHNFSGEISCMITRNMEELGWKASFHHEAGVPFLLQKVKEKNKIQGELDGKMLFQLLEEQDHNATVIFQQYCKDLAKQFYNIQCMIDPQRICIGGGISMQPRFLAELKKAIDDFYEQIPVKVPKADILPCRFFNDSNLIGALYYFQQKFPNRSE